jgi:hypothetical protein
MRASGELTEYRMELERRLAQVCLANAVVKAIVERVDFVSLLRMALGGLEECLPADFVSFFLCGPSTRDASVFAHGPLTQRVAEAMGLSHGTVMSFKSVPPNDSTSIDASFRASVGKEGGDVLELIRAAGLRHVMAEPILGDGRIEAYFVCGRESGGPFQQQDMAFLDQIGMQLILSLRQIRLARDLEQASAELRRSAAEECGQTHPAFRKIAHDLNNALAPILGYTDILLDDDDCPMPSKSKGYLMNIRTAARSISEIISKMRDLPGGPQDRCVRSNS